jgi:hypothetical protein
MFLCVRFVAHFWERQKLIVFKERCAFSAFGKWMKNNGEKE